MARCLRLSQRLCQRLSHRGERLCQRLSRLSRILFRRLWRSATHGEAATGGHRDRTAGAGRPPARPPGNKDGGKLEAQAASRSAGGNATPQGHKQRAQNKRSGGGIGIAQNIKTPYRCIKMANNAHGRKAPGIHREQKKTPHSVSHAGQGCYFWSFARSSRSNTGCNRIYNKINGGTSFQNNLRRCGHPLRRRPTVI